MKQRWAILRWDPKNEVTTLVRFVEAEHSPGAMVAGRQSDEAHDSYLFARPAFDPSLPDHYTKVRGFIDESTS